MVSIIILSGIVQIITSLQYQLLADTRDFLRGTCNHLILQEELHT